MSKITYVRGPDGTPLTESALPPRVEGQRFVPRRKAEIICAIRGGILSEEQALARYNITPEELRDWYFKYDRDGIPGLRVTRTKDYRGSTIRNAA